MRVAVPRASAAVVRISGATKAAADHGPLPHERRIGPADAFTVFGIYDGSPESPDGTRVLYTVLDRADLVPMKELAHAQLWVCDVDGTNARKLRNVEFLVTMHNGAFQQWVDDETIAYSGGHHFPGDVYVIDARTGRTKYGPYTGAMLGDNNFGGHILFSVWSDQSTAGSQGLYDLDTKTGKPTQLYTGKFFADIYNDEWKDGTDDPRGWFFTHLKYSTDGSHLAFTVHPGNLLDTDYKKYGNAAPQQHMFTVKRDLTDLKLWGTDKPMHFHWFDADHIWGVNDHVQDGSAEPGQGLMQVWTRDKRRVETVAGKGCHTARSPDYRWYAAEDWYGTSPVSLYLYRRGETTPAATVFTSPFTNMIWKVRAHVNPAFSPDGKRLYYKRPVAGDLVQAFVVDVDAVASLAAAPAGQDRFLRVVTRYADTMLERGRDVYGEGTMPDGADKKSGLFLSALDRTAPGGPAKLDRRPPAPAGVREADRDGDGTEANLVGANLMHDIGLLLTLNELSRRTGKPAYAQAADENIRWLFDHARSGPNTGYTPGTNLLPWGEHLSWDIERDVPVTARALKPAPNFHHEFYEAWPLWDRTYALSPAGAKAFALALWDHQIRVKTDDQLGDVGNIGDYDRHAEYDRHDPHDEYDFPRHGGYYLDTWAEALAHTVPGGTMADETGKARNLRAEYRAAINAVLTRFERKRADPASHGLIELSDNPRDTDRYALSNALILGIEAWAAAGLLPEGDPLAARLKAYARQEDAAFLRWDHRPASDGFVTDVKISTRQATARGKYWGAAYGGATASSLAMTLLDRQAQLANSDAPDDRAAADRYARLVVEAAEGYLTHGPDHNGDGSLDADDGHIWAGEFGDAIRLELAAWRLTQDRRFLDRGVELGDLAVHTLWGDYALPRASTDVRHYESITGTGYLALALLDLDAATADHAATD